MVSPSVNRTSFLLPNLIKRIPYRQSQKPASQVILDLNKLIIEIEHHKPLETMYGWQGIKGKNQYNAEHISVMSEDNFFFLESSEEQMVESPHVSVSPMVMHWSKQDWPSAWWLKPISLAFTVNHLRGLSVMTIRVVFRWSHTGIFEWNTIHLWWVAGITSEVGNNNYKFIKIIHVESCKYGSECKSNFCTFREPGISSQHTARSYL